MLKLKAYWVFLPVLVLIALGCQAAQEAEGEPGGNVTEVSELNEPGEPGPGSIDTKELDGTYVADFLDMIPELALAQMDAMIEGGEELGVTAEQQAALVQMREAQVTLVIRGDEYEITLPDPAGGESTQSGEVKRDGNRISVVTNEQDLILVHDPNAGTLTLDSADQEGEMGLGDYRAVFTKRA